MLQLRHAPADGIARPWIDRLGLFCRVVVAGDLATIRTGVDDVGVTWIRRHITALSAADRVVVGTIDAAVRASTGDRDGRVVLLSTVKPVRKAVVGSHVIELRGRLILQGRPGEAVVSGD